MKVLTMSLGVLFALSSIARADLSDGLRNYWTFDGNLEDSASDFANDASTVDDDGSFAGTNGTGGINFAAGQFGQAISQNGAGTVATQNDGYVLVNRSADTLYGTTDTLTTSLWVQTEGTNTGWQTILSHGEGNQYRIAWRDGTNPPTVAYAGGSAEGPASPTAILNNSWHHIAAVSEAGVNTRLYYDGQLVSTGPVPNINDQGNGSPANPNLFIGANPQTGANNREWWGRIDDVAQWSRALSVDEIASIYSRGVAGNSLGSIIPEPSIVALLLCGCGCGLLAFRSRRKR
jgi:Concanavalin A-like lectin/glucanases superfamily